MFLLRGSFVCLPALALAPYSYISLGSCDRNDLLCQSRIFPLSLVHIHSFPQVNNYGGLLAIRLCLGFCEGGLLPGMVSVVIVLNTIDPVNQLHRYYT